MFFLFLLTLWLFCGTPVWARDNLFIHPPQIYPEKEFAYLRNPIYQFIRERLSLPGFSLPNHTTLPGVESIFFFDPPGKVKMNFLLRDLSSGKIFYEKGYESSYEDFWKTLERGVEDLKIGLGYTREENKPIEKKTPPETEKKEVKPKDKSIKKDEPSLLSKINPLGLFSKLLPKKEDPLKIKLEIPPPPPPPSMVQSQIPVSSMPPSAIPSPQTTLPPSLEKPSVELLPSPKSATPWQWF